MKPACPQLDAARASGALRYFNGVPCKHGHVLERITANSTCVECNRVMQAKSAIRRKEKIVGWLWKNRDILREKTNARRAANRSQHLATNRAWAEKNPKKVTASRADWAKRNSAHVSAYSFSRRAASKRAMPEWADRKKIAMFYQKAKAESARLGSAIHVDHIVPMQSPIVCGLHNEFNLQLLPKAENQSKGNRWWPDMPGILKAQHGQ
jgi:hypothetical protein